MAFWGQPNGDGPFWDEGQSQKGPSPFGCIIGTTKTFL